MGTRGILRRLVFPVWGMIFMVAAVAACKKEEPVLPEGDADEVTAIHITDPASGKMVLEQGDRGTIKYSLEPENIRRPKLEWSIDKPEVAEVKNGHVTAMKTGKAVVTLRSGAVAANVEVVVKELEIKDFTVPKTISMNTGDRRKVDLTIDPVKANAGCLDWEVADSRIAEVVIEDGEAYVSGLAEGTTGITVKGGNKTAHIDVVVYKSRYEFTYMETGTTKSTTIADKARLNLKNIKGFQSGEHILFFELKPTKDLDLGDCTVEVDNPEICTATFRQDEYNLPCVNVVLRGGDEFGETLVHFTYNDKEKKTEFKRSFTIYRECTFNSNSKIWFPAENRAAEAEETMNGKLSAYIQVDTDGSVPAQWSSSNETVVRLLDRPGGSNVSGKFLKKVYMEGLSLGETVIVAKDEAGNALSFKVICTTAPFPSDLYACWKGKSERLSLYGYNSVPYTEGESNSGYVLELHSDKVSDDQIFVKSWKSDNMNVISLYNLGDNRCALDIKAPGIARIYFTDSAGNEEKVTCSVDETIKGLRLAVTVAQGYNDGGPDTPVTMLWKDNNTSYSKEILLLDRNLKYVRREVKRVYYTSEFYGGGQKDFDLSNFEKGYGRGYLTFQGKPDVWTVYVEDYFGNVVSRKFVAEFSWNDPWNVYAVKTVNGKPEYIKMTQGISVYLDDVPDGRNPYKFDLMVCYQEPGARIKADIYILNYINGEEIPVNDVQEIVDCASNKGNKAAVIRVADRSGKKKQFTIFFRRHTS